MLCYHTVPLTVFVYRVFLPHHSTVSSYHGPFTMSFDHAPLPKIPERAADLIDDIW